MPYSIRKQKCKQSDGDSGSYTLSYTDNKGKKHSACHTSRKKARGQIAAIEGPRESVGQRMIGEQDMSEILLRNLIRSALFEANEEKEEKKKKLSPSDIEEIKTAYIKTAMEDDGAREKDGGVRLQDLKYHYSPEFDFNDPALQKFFTVSEEGEDDFLVPVKDLNSEKKKYASRNKQSNEQVKIGALNLWSDYASTVSLSPKQTGVGPGEEKLANIFGGQVSGQSVSFDLDFPNTSPMRGQWEVKAPDSGGEIRPGTEGIKAFRPINTRLNVIIDEVIQLTDYPDVDELAAKAGAGDLYKKINEFLTAAEISKKGKRSNKTHLELIQGGEITAARFDLIMDMVKAVGDLKKKMQGNLLKVSVNNKEYQVSPLSMVKLSKLLGISDEETKGSVDFADVALALTNLNSPYFDNPEALRELWSTAVNADNVFKVTGVILVTPEGFMPIRRPYGNNLRFSRVTQGKPKFETDLSGASGKGAWASESDD